VAERRGGGLQHLTHQFKSDPDLKKYKKMKASFDFDGCLRDHQDVEDFCRELIARGVEVWIVTSRPERPEEFFEDWDKLLPEFRWSNDDDLFPLAEKLGIPRERIVFTWWKDKALWFEKNGLDFAFHLDDNHLELRSLNCIKGPVGICNFSSGTWRQKCERALAKKSEDKV
jgi:hypothetical protein